MWPGSRQINKKDTRITPVNVNMFDIIGWCCVQDLWRITNSGKHRSVWIADPLSHKAQYRIGGT